MIAPWAAWEDWRAGLYEPAFTPEHVVESVALLLDAERFREAAREMIREWPMATAHNLGALKTGRNAWIGQASCCYSHAAPAAATREAWGQLSGGAQIAANCVAKVVREEWEVGRGRQALLGL